MFRNNMDKEKWYGSICPARRSQSDNIVPHIAVVREDSSEHVCHWEPEHVLSLRVLCGDEVQWANLTSGRQEPRVKNTAWCLSEKCGQRIGVMPPCGWDPCDRSGPCQYN